MTQGIILYGPPASGKDTITAALHKLDERFILFPRLKVGLGRTASYRMITESALDALRSDGEIIWENCRYGATYAVDRCELLRRLADHVPVLHLGQTRAVQAVTEATEPGTWLIVALWCSRQIAEDRLRFRGEIDLSDRMRAWDETTTLRTAHLTMDTGRVPPTLLAQLIREGILPRGLTR